MIETRVNSSGIFLVTKTSTNIQIKTQTSIGVAQLVRYHPAKTKVAGSIPSWGTSLGCGFILVRVCTRGNQLMFLSHIDVSLSLPPSLLLQVILKITRKIILFQLTDSNSWSQVARACPSRSGHKVQPTLDRTSFHLRALTQPTLPQPGTVQTRHCYRHTFGMWRKPESLEQTPTDMGRACNSTQTVARPAIDFSFLTNVIMKLR